MKTPEQKAKELIEEYLSLNDNFNKPIVTDEQDAVKCAIIAVDEMIEILKTDYESERLVYTLYYWQSVKTELETLKN